MTDHKEAEYFCHPCLSHFTRQDILDEHLEYCDQKEAIKIELPEEGTFTNFQKHKCSMRVPFVIYADFECFIEKIDTCQAYPSKPYTKQ